MGSVNSTVNSTSQYIMTYQDIRTFHYMGADMTPNNGHVSASKPFAKMTIGKNTRYDVGEGSPHPKGSIKNKIH